MSELGMTVGELRAALEGLDGDLVLTFASDGARGAAGENPEFAASIRIEDTADGGKIAMLVGTGYCAETANGEAAG